MNFYYFFLGTDTNGKLSKVHLHICHICYIIPPMFRVYSFCLLVFTTGFCLLTTGAGFLDCQRKLHQDNVCVIQDLVCVKTNYECIFQLQHMVLCEKKNQHKSTITATLQKACEKSEHLYRETKQHTI